MKYPSDVLAVIRVQNGFKITRGSRTEMAMEEYVAESDEMVLKLVKEHLESLKPTIAEQCPQTVMQQDEHHDRY